MIRFPYYFELAIDPPRSHRHEDLLLQDKLLKSRIDQLLRDSETTLTAPRNKFQVNLDVQHFGPEDITVKTLDNFVVVECDHEERKDQHGWVSRKFVRRYPIPAGVEVDNIQSKLSSDGVLSIVAPFTKVSNERLVPIVQTGPVSKTADEGNLVRKESAECMNGQ